MAEVAHQVLETTSETTSIKTLAESPILSSAPSAYSFNMNPSDEADPNHPEFAVPVVDMSLLTSGSPDDRAKITRDLAKICEEWGFFIVINHGVEEKLMKGMFDACQEFFSLPEEEKKEFNNSGSDEVSHEMFKYGTSYNVAFDKVPLWRDFMRFQTHPQFFSLPKPDGFSEISREYFKRIREVALEITRAISESLLMEPDYIYKVMNLDRGVQMLAGNYYPPCPLPQHAIGLPPHTDPGLFTILMQNDLDGLQVERNGKWLSVSGPKNCYFVNIADQTQILTNGKYKSSLHRAMVKNKATRITIPLAHGPSLDTTIAPSPELCERYGQPPKYIAMNYKDYLDLQYSGKCYMMSKFDYLRA